jgi:DNA-binding NarL/FixJ family response regulator
MVSVMIVDDSDDIRRMLRAVVADLADPIYECRDDREACAAYARHRPDWVLMDVSMAPMDGVTATHEITDAFPTARIVIVTQYDDVHFRIAAQESGARGYVLKDNVFEVRRFVERLD